MVALCSKTYICTSLNEKGQPESKCSSKGLGNLNNFSEGDFVEVLETGESGQGINRGFVVRNAGMVSYEQIRFGLSFFYSKRRVLADGISTEPLIDPLTGEYM